MKLSEALEQASRLAAHEALKEPVRGSMEKTRLLRLCDVLGAEARVAKQKESARQMPLGAPAEPAALAS